MFKRIVWVIVILSFFFALNTTQVVANANINFQNVILNLNENLILTQNQVVIEYINFQEKTNSVTVGVNNSFKNIIDTELLAQITDEIDLEIFNFLSSNVENFNPNIEYSFEISGQKLFPQSFVDAKVGENELKSNTLSGFGRNNAKNLKKSTQAKKKVLLSPGHGYYKNPQGNYVLQRSYFNGIVEDFINLDLAAQLDKKLDPKLYNLYETRDLDKTNKIHAESNKPLWQMSARNYLEQAGVPASVWNDPGIATAANPEYNKDIRSRPLYANFIKADALISIHNNGGKGCGTETIYDTSNKSRYENQRLAYLIQSKLIQKIRTEYRSNWCDRGAKGFAGNYGENRLSNSPSVIIELAFMDTPSDNQALQDPIFRNIATNAIQEAIDEFLNTKVFEAENLTGSGLSLANSKASNGYVKRCQNCSNNAFVGSLAYNLNSVKEQKLNFQTFVPNLPLNNSEIFTVEAKTYNSNNNLVNTVSKTFSTVDYLNALDKENNEFKDLNLTVDTQNSSLLSFRVFKKSTTTFDIDRVEIQTVLNPAQKPTTPVTNPPASEKPKEPLVRFPALPIFRTITNPSKK